MITALEEAMNYADGIKGIMEMTQMFYEAEPTLSSVLYLVAQDMDKLINLLAIVDAEPAPTNKEVPAPPVTAAEADTETNRDNSITYQELMSKQGTDK